MTDNVSVKKDPESMNLGGNDNKINPRLGAVAIGSAAVLVLVLAAAVIPAVMKKSHTNKEYFENAGVVTSKTEKTESYQAESPSPVVSDTPGKEHEVTSPDELDFWDLYPKNNGESAGNSQIEAVPGGDEKLQAEGNGNRESEETDENDPSKDGKHTKVILRDGSEEWVAISSYLPRNDYDYTNLVCRDDRMEYYTDGKKVSYLGVDISKYQDYIDFNKVKKDGVDFVMIRFGVRGYGTGQITIDDYFFDNIKRATDAGLKVGVYFTSQAVSVEEAVEEAQMVTESLADYRIDYPVAFDMGFVENDTARIEGLSSDERTEIAKTFLDYVSSQGYTGCIHGTKEWFIKEIEMSKLTDYDFWLSQEEDLPDYPYRFSIWQYRSKGTVDGITGFVDLNISFVDYSEK